MNIKMATRMQSFQESIFSELAEIKHSKISKGISMIDLSVGSPDLPPPSYITAAMSEMTSNPHLYGYTLKGTDAFHEAVTKYYHRKYQVDLDLKKEVTLLMGSQDGLVHLPMVLCDPGDIVLVPDPGYTAYEAGVNLAGGQLYPMPLKEENDFLPEFTEVPIEVCKKAKLMILNYPGNPVPALATEAFFKEAIAFAKEHNIVILHDFAYSELYFEERPISFLSVDGAMDVGIEMNSLSKSFNMAGCRVAYAAGNKEVIALLSNLKSNLDYGVFYPIQAAAAQALTDESDFLDNLRRVYKTRRDLFVNGLRELGWNVAMPKGSMFIWAKLPEGFESKAFALELIERANVVVTPGNAFGKWGEGFVRMGIVQSEETLLEVVQRIQKSGILTGVHTK
ncbi:LL-diaminopimelate aminotransferase [Cytobacillus purgationiresistens]|uniref:Aminotransferase n=1 Tax=Cytobacillus purgationiresistens TaxID=863449 RepID=A0ABU0AL79_9BACI|nr:LL-diaminopimelate aminotransferase [Cytobacillus purgationiresistens]MDQ0272022.1 aspartate/methionine/tyrosine aminotransferase [Cytobacillus purgationiresistens]